MPSRVVLKKIKKKDEDRFLELAKKNQQFHRNWVSVPKTSKAFRQYVKVMNTAS